jgi:hypothetical protein
MARRLHAACAGLLLWFLPVGFLAAAAPPALHKEQFYQPGPVSGFLFEGRLYTLRVYKRSVDPLEGVVKAGELEFPDLVNSSILHKEPRGPELISLGCGYLDEGGWYRWRVSQRCLWATGSHANRMARYYRIPMGYLGNAGFVPTLTCKLGATPVMALAWEAAESSQPGAREVLRTTCWDFLPAADRKVYLFRAWKGQLLVWRGKQALDRLDLADEEGTGTRWENEVKTEGGDFNYPPLARLRTELSEPFLAHGDASHFFFVTRSGQIHGCARTAIGGRTRVIWQDPRRPVRLLLTDAATDRTFAFAYPDRPSADAPDVYFPLAEKIVPTALKRDANSPAAAETTEDAMRAAARVLIDAGKIARPTRPGEKR